MRLEHHLVGGYVRYISPYIIIINTLAVLYDSARPVLSAVTLKIHELCQCIEIFH